MGSPTKNTKVARETAEEDFGGGLLEVLSPLTYQGRGGGNPDSPENTGIHPSPEESITGDPIEPRDPLGILSTITGGYMDRGHAGPGYGGGKKAKKA